MFGWCFPFLFLFFDFEDIEDIITAKYCEINLQFSGRKFCEKVFFSKDLPTTLFKSPT